MNNRSFSSAVEMINESIKNGLLKDKLRPHSEYIDNLKELTAGIEYISTKDAMEMLLNANSYWSSYYMEKAILRKLIRAISTYKFGARLLYLEDVKTIRDEIIDIDASAKDGRHRFRTIFGRH